MHPVYVALREVTWHGCMVYTEHRTGSSFTWHHPCNNQTVLQVHHFGGCPKRAMKVYDTDLAAQEQRIALFKSDHHHLIGTSENIE